MFGCVNIFLLENKKLSGMRKNDIGNSALAGDFKKIIKGFQNGSIQNKFSSEITSILLSLILNFIYLLGFCSHLDHALFFLCVDTFLSVFFFPTQRFY